MCLREEILQSRTEWSWNLLGGYSSSSSSRGRRDHVPQRRGTPEQNRVELKSPWRLQQQQQGGGEVARGDVIGQESHSLCVGFSFSIASYISLHYMLLHYITLLVALHRSRGSWPLLPFSPFPLLLSPIQSHQQFRRRLLPAAAIFFAGFSAWVPPSAVLSVCSNM